MLECLLQKNILGRREGDFMKSKKPKSDDIVAKFLAELYVKDAPDDPEYLKLRRQILSIFGLAEEDQHWLKD